MHLGGKQGHYSNSGRKNIQARTNQKRKLLFPSDIVSNSPRGQNINMYELEQGVEVQTSITSYKLTD